MLQTLLALFAALATCAVPQRCPEGWYVDGVRPSGDFSCVKTPAPWVCDTKGGCDVTEDDPWFPMHVECKAGLVPVVNADARGVRCIKQP